MNKFHSVAIGCAAGALYVSIASAQVSPPVCAPVLPWHQAHEEIAVHYSAPNGAWSEAVSYEEGWVVRIHDPHAGKGTPQNYVEGPLWSDNAARVEAETVVQEIGGFNP